MCSKSSGESIEMSHQLDFPTQKVTPPLRRYSIGALTLPSSLSGSPFGPAKPFDPHRTICHIQIKGANADALAERERATSICATFSRAEIKNSVSNKMQMFDFVCGKAIGMAGHNFWPISKSKCVLMHGQTAATTIAFYVLFLCHTHTQWSTWSDKRKPDVLSFIYNAKAAPVQHTYRPAIMSMLFTASSFHLPVCRDQCPCGKQRQLLLQLQLQAAGSKSKWIIKCSSGKNYKK